jgi:phospholipase/carboxylesterase
MLKGAWGELAGLRYVQIEPEGRENDVLPLIVAVHGRGADATDLAGLAQELNLPDYRWVLPQGPRPVQLGPGAIGWAWYELGPQQAATVVASRDMLSAFMDATLARLGTTKDRVLLGGFSQGAVMTLHVGLSSPEPYAGLAAMSGYIPAPESLTPLLPERRERSVLMLHGTYDQVLDVQLARSARALLEEAGLHPEYHEFPMEHQITPESLAVVREYLDRVLPVSLRPER